MNKQTHFIKDTMQIVDAKSNMVAYKKHWHH